MGLSKSPLFAACGAAGARFLEVDGWLLPADFGDRDAEVDAGREGAALLDLAPAGVVQLVGPDARRFCNGMFTNNVRDLVPGRGNRNCMVDDRARIQGLLDLWCVAADTFLAVLDGVTPEAFEARYGKYIIFDDVELTDRSDELGVVSVQGAGAGGVLARAGLPAPAEGFEAVEEVRVARRARARAGGWDVIAPKAAMPALWEGLRAAGARPAGWDAQEALRIEAGLPRWPADFGDKALLHEMRLVQAAGAFDKGCYIGQEVINRIDVMGQVNKKIWGLRMAEDAIPPVGAEVRLAGEPVGTTLTGARDHGVARVLAMLRKQAWTPGVEVEVVAGERTVRAVVSDLPF
ncbi:MAG: YgfZ/GcvT domain-containing protein [Myxococcota bacterium]